MASPQLSVFAAAPQDRERLQELLKKTGTDPPGTRLLDVGCGDGTTSIFLSNLGYQYSGVDISEAAIEKARHRASEANVKADLRVGNAMELSDFRDGEFRIVHDSYCSHLMVTDAHRKAYLASIRRVLSDDGFFVLLAARSDKAAVTQPIGPFPSGLTAYRKRLPQSSRTRNV